ncbi:6-phospho-beta-glucosidase [Planosporangium mesophilum]|uniref:6-phospho-beta-glucosidase n=1 Tax=Planosporangium mesophilum TaxID=689768 RepID=A0A8J3X1K1_9ACTN|nr:6-phospho-beta-glucosidase [Planosporangium mesophilum]NJC84423.1 6-phospho-beta-glucosidase [Planosporangium mesophilum]GII23434.1 6-phospho-beta-glucosidase [Planosporangium mesophilum]
MKLAILGGGGFRVPLVYGALLRDTLSPDARDRRIDSVSLHDPAHDRLAAMGHVLGQMAAGYPGAPEVTATAHLDEALSGADFVFSAIRVGGLAGRTADERVALDLGLLGQETTGPGGLAYGLRTVPVAVHIAERVAAVSPRAWVINFTNPAGMITEAMQQVLGDRVVGICDSPTGLTRRAARALGYDPERTSPDYVGLNHLGWLRGLSRDGTDVLPDLIAHDALLGSFEEGRLFGAGWIRSLGAIPNEYLYYYYFTRDAVASIKGGAATRGEFLLDQQRGFYDAVAADPRSAYETWQRVRRERDATYMKESRNSGDARDVAGERDAADVDGGGYEGVALAIMAAIARNERSTMILNVRNGSTVDGLPPEAVVEVPCLVDAGGPHPLTARPLTGHPLGLVQQVKAVEQVTIRAARTRSTRLALEAFALHPLVDSVSTARVLLDGYRRRIPEVDALFR